MAYDDWISDRLRQVERSLPGLVTPFEARILLPILETNVRVADDMFLFVNSRNFLIPRKSHATFHILLRVVQYVRSRNVEILVGPSFIE